MALSGNAFGIAGAAVLGLVATACTLPALGSTGTSEPATIISLDRAVDAPIGATITADDSARTLRVEDEAIQPVGAWQDEIVLRVGGEPDPNATPVSRFETWDPASGERELAWTGEEGAQEIVTSIDGDWAAVVRTGFELPFPEWTLLLRNLATGEVRTLAEGTPDVLTAEGVSPSLPLGLAPFAVVDGGHVAWAQYQLTGDGGAVRQVVLYDIASGQQTVVAEATPGKGLLESPTLGGGRMAWIASKADGSSARFVVRDLATGQESEYRVEGTPFLLALTSDGRYLAWDDELTAKYSYDLETGELTRFATGEGWGVQAEGSRITWTPAAAFGGTGGYFDTTTGETRVLERREGVSTNVATLLGDWFAWQETNGNETTYYFEPSTPGGDAE